MTRPFDNDKPNDHWFRNSFGENIFNQKYAHKGAQTWPELARTLTTDVCGNLPDDTQDAIYEMIRDGKFYPAGRYLYYAGRGLKAFNNCYLLKAEEDTREDWAELSKKSELCLSSGGGIGVDYSTYRASGTILRRTGGIASGPLAKMDMVNSIGHGIMQGGSRRSAIYASLGWKHGDVDKFLHMKDWYDMPVAGTDMSVGQLKEADFNYRAPMDYTNISVNYDTEWLMNYWENGELGDVFKTNVHQAVSTGEPGLSFNFFNKEQDTLRNACCEVTSADDSDVCNLGSINLSRIDSIGELATIVELSTIFLLCGTLVADLPYKKVEQIREKNRRLGLGLMGVHEWLLKRGYKYEVVSELKQWLSVYRDISDGTSTKYASSLGVSAPVANRAIAPTGSIGILAGTTTGAEPIFAPAFKRRYLKGTRWHYEYVVDPTARTLQELYGVNPDDIECALDLAKDYKRRIKFQAEIQDFVDMAISSTINLPAWGSKDNNDDTVGDFAKTLAKFAHRLRGFTCYPDGARGGQPLVRVDYKDVMEKEGQVFEEVVDVCDITQRGGTCGA